MPKPDISVIVPTYNRADLLPGCLQSLADQTLSAERYEVIIVDNNSTDHTKTIAKVFADKHRHFSLIGERTLGRSHAVNTGVRHAKADYVAFTDDDTKAFPDWLERIVASFSEIEPTPVVVGGEIRPVYEKPPPDWFSDSYEAFSLGDQKHFLQSREECYSICGNNMAVNRVILLELGGFATYFGHVGRKLRMGDDTEIILRVYERFPHIWYDPDIRVQHWVPAGRMRVLYRLRRFYQGAVVSSQLEGTRIFSRKTRDSILRRLARIPSALSTRRHAVPSNSSNNQVQTSAKSDRAVFKRRLMARADRIALIAGRIVGARWF